MGKGDDLRHRIDEARSHAAAVERRWGAVFDLHLSPQDLVSVDAFIAAECPGTPRHILLEALFKQVVIAGIRASRPTATVWRPRGPGDAFHRRNAADQEHA